MKELPQELIVQILLRLPVKSLVRFRAVCKAWLSLISDPSFAKSHFEGSSSTSHNHRILCTVASARQAWSVDFNAPLHDSAVSKIEVPFATTQLRAPVRILGSCRGILLLVLRDFEVVNGLITWNPSTGSIKIIPKAPMLEQKFPLLCGLGYDASTDDYLVAQASYHYGIDVPLTIFETFSVKTNSWRKVEAEGFNQSGTQLMEADYFGCPGEGYLLNGAIHWLAFPLYGVVGNRGAIIAFDLKEKGLQELPIPNDFDYESCNLGVFGGLLGVADLKSPGEVGIWVMTDYGVKSSWIHLFTVSLAVIDSIYFLPLCLSKGGELVGIGDQGLVKLGKNGKLLEQHEYCHDKMDFSANGSVYTESLLSLPISHGDESEDR